MQCHHFSILTKLVDSVTNPLSPQFPTFPPMMYYYPTAMPLNTGYGGAAVIPPIMRYRSYITPDMIDYNGFNNVSFKKFLFKGRPKMGAFHRPIILKSK